MHPRELARQSGEASLRINAAAAAIGERLGLEPPPFGKASARRGGPEVARLRERQMQADYLEAISEALAKPRKRTAPVSLPTASAGEGQDGAEQGAGSEGAESTDKAEAAEPTAGAEVAVGAGSSVGGSLPPPLVA